MKNGIFEIGDRVRVKPGTEYYVTLPGAVGIVDSLGMVTQLLDVDFTNCSVVSAREKVVGYEPRPLYCVKPEDVEFIPNDDLAKEADARLQALHIHAINTADDSVLDVIRNRAPIFFDMDMTLLMWTHNALEKEGTIPVEWEGTTFHLVPHARHIEELKQHAKNGKAIIVWSRRGYEWAEAAVKALKLEAYVRLVLEKPFIYYDDQEASEFMRRVYHEAGHGE